MEVGAFSLDGEQLTERANEIMAGGLGELSGNDCLWVLGTVVGNILGDAPPERRQRMLVAFHTLVAYSLERAVVVKGARRHHEEGHA